MIELLCKGVCVVKVSYDGVTYMLKFFETLNEEKKY